MKKQVIRAVALLLAAALCGCAQPEPPAPVEITLMHGWGGSAQDHVAMRAIYEDFEKKNPDIRLSYNMSPDISVVLEKADDMLAVDRIPDIVSTNGYVSMARNAMTRGKALDLTPYIEADAEFASNISSRVRETWTDAQDGLYTLPDVQEICGYWYNAEFFRLAGVTEDGTPNSPVRLPQTFGELFAACDQIDAWAQSTGRDVTPILMDRDQALILLGARIAAGSPEGAAFMRNERETCPEPELTVALDAVDTAYSYYKGDAAGVNDAREFFFHGKSAVYFNGVWANISLRESPEQEHIRCAAFPGEYGKTVSFVSSSTGYVIGNTGSQQKIDACVRFLKYMLSEEVQRRIVTETGQVPSNPKVDPAWITKQSPSLGEALEACLKADEYILDFKTLLSESRINVLNDYFERRSSRAGLVAAFTAPA